MVALASAILLRERPGRAAILGIVLCLVGSLLIFAADARRAPGHALAPMLGNAQALVGAVAASGYLLMGRAVRARVSLTAYIWLAYSSAALLLLALVAIMRVPVFALPERAWLFMAALALGPQLIGHTSFNWALRRLTATFVAVAILGEPVGAALLAWLVFGERFSALQLIGFVALLGGIFVAAREEKRSAVPL